MRRPVAAAVAAMAVVVVCGVACLAAPAYAKPAVVLDDGMVAVWQAAAKQRDSAVGRAIVRCSDITARPTEFVRDHYMGLDWAQYLQACLVAYVATGNEAHAKTAMRYAMALADDLEKIGDGRGGNEAARRDSGFSIRALGPNLALAYDWLYDHPLMTKAVKAKLRERLWAWVSWYRASGYRARAPGNNYHAGYVAAATLGYAAIERDLTDAEQAQWAFVKAEIWDTDMKAALAAGGVLEGGDWPEGWQYGPLAVVNYALAGRALSHRGYELAGFTAWSRSLLPRFLHGLAPNGMMFVGGDTQAETPSLPANSMVLAAVIIADPNGAAAGQARALIAAKKLQLREFPLIEALAESIPADATKVASIGRSYVARGSGTLYARTLGGGSNGDAVWMAMQCSKTLDVDHRPPNTGNLVISRGRDELVVDPSPYGSLSSLTSNAPTVSSPQLPDDYRPSQAFWGKSSGFAHLAQTSSGAVTLRCEYGDQYAFQSNPSDVRRAYREVALVPYQGGKSAAVFVFDAAEAATERTFHLRFRSPGRFDKMGDAYSATVGASQLGVFPVGFAANGKQAAKAEARILPKGDCFRDGVARGACDAARFASNEYRAVLSGTKLTAGHVLDVTAQVTRPRPPTPLMITGATPAANVEGWSIARGDETLFAARVRGRTSFALVLPKGAARGAVLFAEPVAVEVKGSLRGENCHIDMAVTAPNRKTERNALVVAVDKDCLALVEHADSASDLVMAAHEVAGTPADPSSGADDSAASAPLDPETHRTDRELQTLPQGVAYQGTPDPLPTAMPKRGCAASVGGGDTHLGAFLMAVMVAAAARCLRRYRSRAS